MRWRRLAQANQKRFAPPQEPGRDWGAVVILAPPLVLVGLAIVAYALGW